MFSAVVKNNVGIVIAKAPCCMTLDQAMDFADSSAIDYREDNAVHYESSGITQYPYVSITITSGTSTWWKWYPVGRDIAHTECGM